MVRPYPQVQMLPAHHAVASATPVAVTAPPAHLTPAVPLSFSEGLMKVTAFKVHSELQLKAACPWQS